MYLGFDLDGLQVPAILLNFTAFLFGGMIAKFKVWVCEEKELQKRINLLKENWREQLSISHVKVLEAFWDNSAPLRKSVNQTPDAITEHSTLTLKLNTRMTDLATIEKVAISSHKLLMGTAIFSLFAFLLSFIKILGTVMFVICVLILLLEIATLVQIKLMENKIVEYEKPF
jgi:hypothetical protein